MVDVLGFGASGAERVRSVCAFWRTGGCARQALDIRGDQGRLGGDQRGLEDQLGAVFDGIVHAHATRDLALRARIEVADLGATRIHEGLAVGQRTVVDLIRAGHVGHALRQRKADPHSGRGRAAQVRERELGPNHLTRRDRALRVEGQGPQGLGQSLSARRENTG